MFLADISCHCKGRPRRSGAFFRQAEGAVARNDAGRAGNLRSPVESRWIEGLRAAAGAPTTTPMSKVKLLSLLLVAVLFALMLAGAHHPIGMNDGGYW